MISKIKTILLLAFISAVSTGCGGPSAITVKPDALKNIHSIAVLEIKKPLQRMMDLGSSTPWGAISATNDMKEIQPRFDAILKKEKFSFNTALTRDLYKALKHAGYKTYSLKVKRPDAAKLLEDYSQFKSKKVDALLDVAVVSSGYVVENFITSNFWRPEARVFVRLVNTSDGTILYQDTMMYGYHNPFMSGVDIDAPEKFHFSERADIFKAGDKTLIAGITDASKKVAQEISHQLKK